MLKFFPPHSQRTEIILVGGNCRENCRKGLWDSQEGKQRERRGNHTQSEYHLPAGNTPQESWVYGKKWCSLSLLGCVMSTGLLGQGWELITMSVRHLSESQTNYRTGQSEGCLLFPRASKPSAHAPWGMKGDGSSEWHMDGWTFKVLSPWASHCTQMRQECILAKDCSFVFRENIFSLDS